MDRKNYNRKRMHVRYKPDALSIGLVEFNPKGNNFKADVSALIFEESFSGCCLVLVLEVASVMEDVWRVRVGEISPLLAEVVWIKNLDKNIYKVGLKYIQ